MSSNLANKLNKLCGRISKLEKNTPVIVYDQSSTSHQDKAAKATVNTNFMFNLSWTGYGFVQKCGNVGHLSLRVQAIAPFLAQNPVIITLPAEFHPAQDVDFVPFSTADGGSPTMPYKQQATLSLKQNGEITNLNTTLDQNTGEWFDINIIFLCK